MRHVGVSVALFVGILLASAQVAVAGGNGATSSTQITHNVTQTFPVGPICGSPGGLLTLTSNSVFHITVNKAGDFWVTGTTEGWFTIVPSDPTLPNFAGHIATWFGESSNARNDVQHDITNIRAIATDGSGTTITIHAVDHLSTSASGQVNAFFSCS